MGERITPMTVRGILDGMNARRSCRTACGSASFSTAVCWQPVLADLELRFEEAG